MAIHCIGCLDRLADENEPCERCVGQNGYAPDQHVASGLRQAVEIVGAIIRDDLMGRRDVKWPLERVLIEHPGTWRKLVIKNIDRVLAVIDGERRGERLPTTGEE